MPTITDIATGTRCPHGADVYTCPWCETPRQTGQRLTRSARRLSAAIRRAIRDAENERDETNGYGYLAGTVSANGATSHTLRAITRAGETVGAEFYSDVTGETVGRFARYIARPHRSPERLQRALTDTRYAYRLARAIARSIATDTGTGRGSMGRFTVDTADAENELRRIYRDALRTSPAFTVATGRCPVHGRNGCPLPRWRTDAETGQRVRVADGCPMSRDLMPRRAMTDAERDLIRETLSPERVERSPAYSQWWDGLGQTLPDVRDGHGYGHVAPYVPERDAYPLRRGDIFARLRAVGADGQTVRALRYVWDAVNVPDENGRYRSTAPWTDARNETGATVTAGTLQRRARRYAADVRARERRARGRRWAVDTAGTVCETDGAPFTIAENETPGTRTRLATVRTGNYVGRGTWDGTPVTVPVAPYTWQTVGAHLTDAETGAELCERGGRCADGCDALQLMPVRTSADTGTRPLWQTGNGCGHGADGCPNTCPVRVARARRVARWDAITGETDAETVRAVVARNASERDA